MLLSREINTRIHPRRQPLFAITRHGSGFDAYLASACGPHPMTPAYAASVYRAPMTSVAPKIENGTFRRGLVLSSARGADVSKPRNMNMAKIMPLKMPLHPP